MNEFSKRGEHLARLLRERIVIIDGAMGTMIQRYKLAEAEWGGRAFTLVDTGGLGLLRGEKANDVIVQAALRQVELAIEASNVIILVVNAQEGIVPLDREVAERLRKCGKPVLVAVNKSDTFAVEAGTVEFSELGFENVFPVSAIHDRGIDALMQAGLALLPLIAADLTTETPADEPTDAEALQIKAAEPLKLAIVGRPNV